MSGDAPTHGDGPSSDGPDAPRAPSADREAADGGATEGLDLHALAVATGAPPYLLKHWLERLPGLREAAAADAEEAERLLLGVRALLWVDGLSLEAAAAILTAEGPAALSRRARAAAAPARSILANILAGPLRRLAPALRRIAAPGAVVVLAGLLDRQARSVQATYAGHGFNCIQAASIRGWTVLTFRLGGGFGRPQRLQPSRR